MDRSLMGFSLTEEQKQLKALVRDFCKREVDQKLMWDLVEKAGRAKTIEELRAIQPWDLIKKMHDVGLRQLAVPKEYGGGGFTIGHNLTRIMLGEELGYSGGHAFARLLTKDWQTCNIIATPNTTKEQKDWFFPKYMEDPTGLCAHVGSEPQGTSDMILPYDEPGVALKTLAHKEGNEWIINGDKMFSSGGAVAKFNYVTVRTDKKGPVSKSLSVFWVLKDTPGMTMDINNMIMPDIYGNVQIHFDNVRIPECQLIGNVNNAGMDLLATKPIAFSSMLGQTRSIYEQMVEYAKQRVQGGKPIIQHSSIAAMLGELAIMIEATRSLFYRAAWEIDEREKAGMPREPFWAFSTFYLVKRLCLLLAEVATDIYGGIVSVRDLPIASFIQNIYVMVPGGGPMSMDKIKSSMHYNDHTLGEPWKKVEYQYSTIGHVRLAEPVEESITK